jgi:hypothetical protein
MTNPHTENDPYAEFIAWACNQAHPGQTCEQYEHTREYGNPDLRDPAGNLTENGNPFGGEE